MLKIGKLTDYAIIILEFMARGNPGKVYAAPELADAVKLAIPTVSKVLKQLTKNRIIRSTRGVHGGYTLIATPAMTNVALIIQAMEGPIALTECETADRKGCEQSGSCQARQSWEVINRAVCSALESVSLADMVAATPPVRREFPVQIDNPLKP